MTCALNIFLERNLVVLHFDDGAHGSHVAGIAAGYNIYATPLQPGYNGIAPGAELISLKISDGRIGQLSTTGSMKKAYDYAAHLARTQPKPVVVNMSFGVASELEGHADIEKYLDSLLEVTPNLYVCVSMAMKDRAFHQRGYLHQRRESFLLAPAQPRHCLRCL
jgi:Subtilase family.